MARSSSQGSISPQTAAIYVPAGCVSTPPAPRAALPLIPPYSCRAPLAARSPQYIRQLTSPPHRNTISLQPVRPFAGRHCRGRSAALLKGATARENCTFCTAGPVGRLGGRLSRLGHPHAGAKCLYLSNGIRHTCSQYPILICKQPPATIRR